MKLCPYIELMRIHKPAGWFLFLWPYAFGLTMSAFKARTPYAVYFSLLAKFFIGSFVVRSSVCTVNDIFDRKLDASVERTKIRPLPSGRISVLSASVFFVVQLIIAVFFFSKISNLTCWLAILQMGPMLSIYPLMKRVTYWPQAWLGIAINFGYLVSWYAIGETTSDWSSDSTLIMLFGLWCWTMVYDTIYGCQDRKDDIKVGIWSTAVLFGRYTVLAVKSFAMLFLVALFAAGKANNQGAPYFIISFGATLLFLYLQFKRLDVESSASCWENFKGHAYYLGPIIYTGMLVDYVRIMSISES
ncbi:hypothetical protein ACEPAI_4270 [Sanghuangporus weigelae]